MPTTISLKQSRDIYRKQNKQKAFYIMMNTLKTAQEYQAPVIECLVECGTSSVICASGTEAGTESFTNENSFDWGI